MRCPASMPSPFYAGCWGSQPQYLLQAPAASALTPAAGKYGDPEADPGDIRPIRQTAGCKEDNALSCAGALHYHQRRSGVPADETDEATQNEYR